ncbi:hypothetical protein ACWAUP_004783 [Pseudomonas aeruginosa]
MHQQASPSQFSLELCPPAPRFPALPMCPGHLLPDAVVSESDPLLSVSDLDIRESMRAQYSFEQMSSSMEAIIELAEQRQQFGIRGLLGLGGPRTYQDVGTQPSAMDWMHEHELKRINQIKLSLPSAGEEMLAARDRIQQRIAARRRGR